MKSFKKTFYRPNPRAKSVHEIQAAQTDQILGPKVSTKSKRLRSHDGPAKPCAGCASAWDCTARRASGVEGKLTLLVSMLGRAL